MEAHVIVHSVFCFTLLCVCALHFLCVCLEGHSALLHTPRFQWGRPFSVGDPIFLLSTVYGLPPLSPLSTLPLFFFSMKRGPAAVSLLPKSIFLQVRLLFSTWHFFFCQLNDTVCRVGAWVGCKGFFAGCGGPERTPRHQRVKESEAEGYTVLPKRLGTPTSLSVPPLPATPPASAFARLWLARKGHRGQNH